VVLPTPGAPPKSTTRIGRGYMAATTETIN
jgi:hypothetical protein